ncbi:MAG: hypothetical protein ACW986_02150 [Promethearchaeota archaeon]|jgi:hypothetical protein
MTKVSVSERLKEIFGENLYQKSLKFPKNKINIFDLREEPFKVRSIILDNDREYLLLIDEKKKEIFHDCPIFRIYSEKDKKICVHLVKLVSILKAQYSSRILENINSYNFSSDDFQSRKKSKNFSILANQCSENNNCVEALNYLNKVIINQQYESDAPITEYLTLAIDNDLFIEFFEFLEYFVAAYKQKNGLSTSETNEIQEEFHKFDEIIESGFQEFLTVIKKYSLDNLLKIIESIDKIFQFKNSRFVGSLIITLRKLVKSANFNESYFSIYLIQKHKEVFIKLNMDFEGIITQNELDSLKVKSLAYFLSEIDNFCLIDKLKLLKKHFKIIDVPKEKYIQEYKNYKVEIKQLEKRLYLKKFSYLKLLMERYDIKRTKGGFRKTRSDYIVNHDKENLEKPVYTYIINRMGFTDLEEQYIKSPEIGINYFIMQELFSDDLSTLHDVKYYKTQFWGEENNTINSLEGIFLTRKSNDYVKDTEQTSYEDVQLIEWDLTNKPALGSIVSAYGSQNIIPDQNNPLFHDLKPFDLCYCKKTPVKIESNIIKTINVITKCSFKDAINSVSQGMAFIEGYYPLSIVRAVLDKDLNPFQANELVLNNPDKDFIPNYTKFIQAFRQFLFDFILKEKNYVFEKLKLDFEDNTDQILLLLGLTNEVSGLDLDYPIILKDILHPKITLEALRSLFLVKTHELIQDILSKQEKGSTGIFNLKEMRHSPFIKYSEEIIQIRKEEFESTGVTKFYINDDTHFNITEISKTYYGKKISRILSLKSAESIKSDKFKKFHDYAKKLKLKISIINS